MAHPVRLSLPLNLDARRARGTKLKTDAIPASQRYSATWLQRLPLADVVWTRLLGE